MYGANLMTDGESVRLFSCSLHAPAPTPVAGSVDWQPNERPSNHASYEALRTTSTCDSCLTFYLLP